jgi:molecular chaperone DnaK
MKVLVYDLGGGTFDVTILDLRPGDLRTLATDGDVQLGGYDWDMRLVNFASDEFKKLHRLDPRENPAALAALLASAEEAKHTLTARPKTTLTIRLGGHTLELTITREQFEELTEDLLERTAYTSRQVIAAAGLTWQQINRILLVGGSTRMPMVPRMLEKLTGQKPDHTVHADEAVARGAAIFAGYVLHRRDPNAKPTFKVVDVNAHSLGIEGIDQRTLRKENIILLPRNSPLPAKVTEKFVTKTEDQISIVVSVLEGESKIPAQCSMIGRAVIRNLPEHLPKGWPVEVTYEYLTNGRLDVHAKIPGTSRQVDLELQRDQSMTSERIGRWKNIVQEAKGFDAFDDMLDDVVLAHRIEKRKDVQSPAPAAVGAASSVAARAGVGAGSDSDKRPTPSTDLKGASRAFDEAGAATEEESKSTAAAKSTAAKAASSGAVADESTNKKSSPSPSAPKKPMTLAEAAAARAGAKLDSDPYTLAPPTPRGRAKPAEARRASGLSPGVRWLMSVIALLLVSAVSLLICYYVLAWFGRMGNFMHLPLPGLPAPKAAQTTMSAPLTFWTGHC